MMTENEAVFQVPEMSHDRRVHVFRRNFHGMEEFAEMTVDAYVIVTERYVIVLDTMLCPEDAALMMRMMGNDLVGRSILVVNSHADWDHAWGNAYFTGEHAAPIFAHDQGPIRMRSEEAHLELANYQHRDPFFHNVVLVPATFTFNDHLTIHENDLTIELFASPGHQRDHIAAWLPQLSLLLAFDAVEKPLPCLENAASVPPMFATLNRCLNLKPQRVLCSHGKSTHPQLITENLAYLDEIERRSREFLQVHQTRHLTGQELDQPARLINYPFDEVIAGSSEPVDRTFYSWAHDANVRSMLQWLLSSLWRNE